MTMAELKQMVSDAGETVPSLHHSLLRATAAPQEGSDDDQRIVAELPSHFDWREERAECVS